jgi:hypothetical protein
LLKFNHLVVLLHQLVILCEGYLLFESLLGLQQILLAEEL